MTEQELYDKWEHRIGDGWYGFDIAGVPAEWITKIDKFLTWLEQQHLDFRIKQIKVKFSHLRCYIDLGLTDGKVIDNQILKVVETKIKELEELCDENLIYFKLNDLL